MAANHGVLVVPPEKKRNPAIARCQSMKHDASSICLISIPIILLVNSDDIRNVTLKQDLFTNVSTTIRAIPV